MSKILAELKAKRAVRAEALASQEAQLQRLEAQWREDQIAIGMVISDYRAEVYDLDKAIEALSPAPVADPEITTEFKIEPPAEGAVATVETVATAENAENADAVATVATVATVAEVIDAAPEAQILRSDVPLDAPVLEDGAGAQFAILQGEPVEIISAAPVEAAPPQEEPYSAPKHGGDAGVWASWLYGRKQKADA